MDAKMQASARDNLEDELNGAYLYDAPAHAEQDCPSGSGVGDL